jgi:hypothetical protein
MVQLIQHLTQHWWYNWYSWYYCKFKSGGGLEISQITESAGYVVVGGSGSYTDKFEVIGNVKANAFVGSGTLTGITKSIVGLGSWQYARQY